MVHQASLQMARDKLGLLWQDLRPPQTTFLCTIPVQRICGSRHLYLLEPSFCTAYLCAGGPENHSAGYGLEGACRLYSAFLTAFVATLLLQLLLPFVQHMCHYTSGSCPMIVHNMYWTAAQGSTYTAATSSWGVMHCHTGLEGAHTGLQVTHYEQVQSDCTRPRDVSCLLWLQGLSGTLKSFSRIRHGSHKTQQCKGVCLMHSSRAGECDQDPFKAHTVVLSTRQ